MLASLGAEVNSLTREVLKPRSWFLEITAIWGAVGALAYAGASML